MKIQESAQMYLKTIYVLSLENNHVRSIDISKKMHFTKPSVSRAINNLKSEEYIDIHDNGYIVLTKKGLKIAKDIYTKHNVLVDFLTGIGVKENIADDDACRIEHVISEETYKALNKFNKQLSNQK